MRFLRILFRALASLATIAAMLGACVLAVCARLPVEHRLGDLLAQFVAPALTVMVVVTMLAALARIRTATVSGLIGCIVLAVAVWPQWFPQGPKAQADSEEITVYWSNVWARNTDLDAIAASVAAASPDIVLMAEVGDLPADNLDIILPDHPYRVVSMAGNRRVAPARTLVASRWPIRPHREEKQDHLSAVSAIVQTPLGNVGVMASHLTRPWPYKDPQVQARQVEDMAIQRPLLGERAIIAGDFNSISSARIGRQVQQSMNLIPVHSPLGTWPAKLPAVLGITIDQVWHSPELALTHRALGLPNGSDHRPVVTRFTLSDQDPR